MPISDQLAKDALAALEAANKRADTAEAAIAALGELAKSRVPRATLQDAISKSLANPSTMTNQYAKVASPGFAADTVDLTEGVRKLRKDRAGDTGTPFTATSGDMTDRIRAARKERIAHPEFDSLAQKRRIDRATKAAKS